MIDSLQDYAFQDYRTDPRVATGEELNLYRLIPRIEIRREVLQDEETAGGAAWIYRLTKQGVIFDVPLGAAAAGPPRQHHRRPGTAPASPTDRPPPRTCLPPRTLPARPGRRRTPSTGPRPSSRMLIDPRSPSPAEWVVLGNRARRLQVRLTRPDFRLRVDLGSGRNVVGSVLIDAPAPSCTSRAGPGAIGSGSS